jgi:hypothetical protein
MCQANISVAVACRHKTRQHITQLVKDTSDKLKQASEADHRVEVSVCAYLYIIIRVLLTIFASGFLFILIITI